MRVYSRGFSLIEVIIAIAVMTIAALGFMQLMKSQIDGNTFIMAQAVANQKAWELTLVLRNKAACDANMTLLGAAATFNPGDPKAKVVIPKIERKAGSTLIETGAVTADGVFIENVEIGGFKLSGVAAAGVYDAKIFITMRIDKSGLVKNFLRESIFSVKTAPGGAGRIITSCFDSTDLANESLADKMGVPGFPNQIICTAGAGFQIYTIRECSPPNSCRYKLPGYSTDNHMVRYTRSAMDPAKADRSAKEGKGKRCPLMMPVDGKAVQGPFADADGSPLDPDDL